MHFIDDIASFVKNLNLVEGIVVEVTNTFLKMFKDNFSILSGHTSSNNFEVLELLCHEDFLNFIQVLLEVQFCRYSHFIREDGISYLFELLVKVLVLFIVCSLVIVWIWVTFVVVVSLTLVVHWICYYLELNYNIC